MAVEAQPVAAADAAVSSGYRFVMAGLILAAQFLLGLNLTPLSPLLPLVIRDYALTRAAAGLLVALPMLVKACVGLPGSALVGRIGLKRVFTVGWFLTGLMALAAIVSNYPTLLVLAFFYGLGSGLMMPAIGFLVMQWFQPKEIPVMNSLGLVVMSLGISVSVFLAVPLATFMPWHSVLGLFGALALAGAVAWSLLGRTHVAAEVSRRGMSLRDMGRVLRDRTVLLLVVGDALVFIFYTALTSWLPTFLHEFRGLSLEQAGNVTGLLPSIGMLSVVVGGVLTLKVRSRRLLFIVPGIMVGLGGLGTILFHQAGFIIPCVILLGIGTWVYQPALLTVPMQMPWMTPEKVAVVWGTSLTIAELGMFISPIVVGASRDFFGTFVPGFLVFAVPAWTLVISGVLLPEKKLDTRQIL